MHAFTKLTKDSVGGLAAGLGKGIHAVSSTVEHKSDDHHPTEPGPVAPPTPSTTSAASGLAKDLTAGQSEDHEPTVPSPATPQPSLLGSLTSTTTSAASGLGKGLHAVTSTVGQSIQPQAHHPTESSPDTPQPSLLGSLTSTTTSAASGLGKGLHAVTSAVGQSIQPQAHQPTEPSPDTPQPTLLGSLTSTTTSAASGLGKGLHAVASTVGQSIQPQAHQSGEPSTATLPLSLLGTLTSTTTAAANVARSGATLAFTTTRDITTAGLSIGSSVARSGLDASANVVSLTAGTASLAGTALGAVVTAAADTSGAVFEPVTSGLKTLKALEEFDHLKHGVDTINGLSLAAVKRVSDLTTKALKTNGKVRVLSTWEWLNLPHLISRFISPRPRHSLTPTQTASSASPIRCAASPCWVSARSTRPTWHMYCTAPFHTRPQTAGCPRWTGPSRSI